MRKTDTAAQAATTEVAANRRRDASMELVCLALVLALAALVARIAMIW